MTRTGWQVWWSRIRRWGGRWCRLGGRDPRPTGPEGVAILGHRDYVGGRWEELGRLQFDFLRDHGLRPEHVLLDVACGSLRAGVHLIPFLEPGHYWGLEKERSLIDAGQKVELDAAVSEFRRPRFLVNSNFDVSVLDRTADFIWIHSLFTHLTLPAIELCLTNLGSAAGSQTKCFATFFETSQSADNPHAPHDHEVFYYTRDELQRVAEHAGWRMTYLGDWGHPRGQRMLEFTFTGKGRIEGSGVVT